MIERFDNSWVLERRSNLAFRRFLQTFEPSFQRVGLGLIQNFETDNLAGLSISRHVEIRHGAGNGFAQDLIPAGHIDLAAFQKRFNKLANSHNGERTSVTKNKADLTQRR